MTAPIETGDIAEFEQEFATSTTAPGKTPLVIKLLVAATFVVILNETIMANALPALITEFDITERTAQWISTAFMLTMAAVIPVTGWFLQRVTTRAAYATAMITFSVGTAVAMVAPSFEVLIAGRVIQAAGTAVMMPLLMTTLMTVVDAQDRGRVMGQVTLAISVAPALGPTASGLILEVGSWRLIFGVVLPIAAAVGFFGFRAVQNVGEPQAGKVSWLSVLLAASGFSAFVFGLSKIGASGWVETSAYVGSGLVLIAAFVGYQIWLVRNGSPLLDLRTLRHATYTKSLLLMSAGFMAFLGSMILIPLYLVNLRGLTELEAGLLVMPGGLAMGLAGPQVGKAYDRFGSRILVVPGAAGMTVALLLFSRIGVDTAYWQILLIHVFLMGCLALIFTPVFTIGLGDLPPQLYSHGSSLLGALQQVSGAMGTALLIAVMSDRSESLALDGVDPAHAFVGGMEWAFYIGAAAGAVVVVLALLLPNRVDAPAGHGH